MDEPNEWRGLQWCHDIHAGHSGEFGHERKSVPGIGIGRQLCGCSLLGIDADGNLGYGAKRNNHSGICDYGNGRCHGW